MKKIEEMTIKEALEEMEKAQNTYNELSSIFAKEKLGQQTDINDTKCHPMLNKRCIIRTYIAGVHIGTVAYINPENSMEVKLVDALRLWKWTDGGLSLSAIANNGIKGGRLNRTGEVYLTNAIEYIPITKKAEETFDEFIED